MADAEAHNLTHKHNQSESSRDGLPPGPRAPGVRDAGHPQRAHATRHRGPATPTPATGIRRRTVHHVQCVCSHPKKTLYQQI